MDNQSKRRIFSFWQMSDTVLNIITVILLSVIFGLMLLQIIMRYFFNNPLTWSEELTRLSLFWMAFLGSVIAVREKSHICVDLVIQAFPQKLSRPLVIVTDILILAFLCGLCIWGIRYCKLNMNAKSLVTGIVKGHVYTIIPISAVWMGVYHIRNMVSYFTKKKAVDECIS